MKKLLRSVLLALPMFMGLSFVSSCGDTGELTELQQLERIYEIVKANGYEGSFEDWMKSLQGDQVELRTENGFIQWRYSNESEWVNLIPLTELKGATGVDGLTPYIGENGNWWVGAIDTKVAAEAKDGLDGLTPYVGENGNWWIGDIDTNVVAQAQDGENGLTPYVGDNGNWWIGDIDTNVVAVAKDGEDGLTPYVGENGNWWIGDIDTQVVAVAQDGLTPYVGENGNWWIGDIDTNVVAVAKDGLTPYVGENGNWWIGDIDTNVVAVAKDGKDGLTPYIGENGNWWIGETDTNVKSSITGATGKSAYELFKELHPEYDGDEEKWLDDLVNGRLSEGQFKYFTVTFYDENGNVLSTEKVLNSSAIEKPDTPLKTGYIFTGWYVGGEKWNFDSNVVLKDIDLIASYVKSNIDPTVSFTYTDASEREIYFDYYVDNVSTVEAVALYKNGELIQTLENLNERQFSNLLSNTTYRVEVTYSYDLNDGFGKQYETEVEYVTTDAVNIPSVSLENISSTYNSVTFDINEIDESNICDVKNIELYSNGSLIKEVLPTETLSFDGLLSGVNYTLKVNYSYDLNEGNELYQEYQEYNFVTEALARPEIVISDITTTHKTIDATISINDFNGIDELVAVKLFLGDQLIETGTSLNLSYQNLVDNSEYTIVVEHIYDLNDGNGRVGYADYFYVSTHPVYQLLETNILNTSAIVEDDMVYIHAVVDNPSSATFKSVFINGVEYEVNPSSTSNNVYVTIPQVKIGDTVMNIEKMVAELDGASYEYYTENNNNAVATIYEKLSVDSIEITNSNFERIDYAFASDETYVVLHLNNPNGYNIDNIDSYITSSDLIKIDNNTYAFKHDFEQCGISEYAMSTLTYSGDSFTRVINSSSLKTQTIVSLSDDNIYEISSVEDLLNENYLTYEYRYYKLTADLDLSSIEWNALERMWGVFDGNNHTIKNMKTAKTFYDTSVDLGLFKDARGMFKDLSMESVVIMVELYDTDSNTYDIRYGAFASYDKSYGMSMLLFENCNIDNNSSISIKNNTGGTIHAGGFVGGTNDEIIEIRNSSNRSNINVESNCFSSYQTVVGAFVGSGSLKAINSFNTGNIIINGEYIANCIFSGNFSKVELINTYNTGSLNGEYGSALINGYNIIKKSSYSFEKEYANQVIDFTENNYSFALNNGYTEDEVVVSTIVLDKFPFVERKGYLLEGWYDNENFEGEPIKLPYYSKEDVTLYAKWKVGIGTIQNLNGITVYTGTPLDKIVLDDYSVAVDRNGKIIYASRSAGGYGGPGDGFYHDGSYEVHPGSLCGIFNLHDDWAPWPSKNEAGESAWLLYDVVVPVGGAIYSGSEEAMLPFINEIFDLELNNLNSYGNYFEQIDDCIYNDKVIAVNSVDLNFIGEVENLVDGAKVEMFGIVKEINKEWSSETNSMSVTLTDDFGNTLFVNELASNVKVGDLIVVFGNIEIVDGVSQIASGATSTLYDDWANENL